MPNFLGDIGLGLESLASTFGGVLGQASQNRERDEQLKQAYMRMAMERQAMIRQEQMRQQAEMERTQYTAQEEMKQTKEKTATDIKIEEMGITAGKYEHPGSATLRWISQLKIPEEYKAFLAMGKDMYEAGYRAQSSGGMSALLPENVERYTKDITMGRNLMMTVLAKYPELFGAYQKVMFEDTGIDIGIPHGKPLKSEKKGGTTPPAKEKNKPPYWTPLK